MNCNNDKNDMIELVKIKVHPYSKHYTNGHFQAFIGVLPYHPVMKRYIELFYLCIMLVQYRIVNNLLTIINQLV